VRDAKHASVPLRRVRAGELRWEKFLYELKAGPAGGLRPPSGPAATDGHRGAGLTVQRSQHRHHTLIGTLSSPGFGHAKEKAPAAAGCSDGTLPAFGLGVRQSAGVSVGSNGACRGGSGGAAGRGASRWPSQPAGRSPAGRPAARRGSPRGIPRAATTRIESTRWRRDRREVSASRVEPGTKNAPHARDAPRRWPCWAHSDDYMPECDDRSSHRSS
jgi:hypothetical protein